jgi:uncharacterized protein (TIRG00374 family)
MADDGRAATAPDADASDSPAPTWTRIFTLISVVIAIGALALTIWSVGPRTLLSQLKAIGWGFAAVIVIECLITLCDSAALSSFLGIGGRRPSYFQVVRAQLAGRAINAVTPMASLGEATKATTLMQRTGSRRAIAAVFHYNLANVAIRLATIAIGAPICALALDLPHALEVALFAGGAIAGALVIAGALLARRGMLVSFVDAVRTLRVISAERAARWRKKMLEIDRYQPKHARARARWIPFSWLVLSRLLSVASMWAVLASVGYIAGPGTIAAIATGGAVITMVASIVPMGLGISEGSNAALFLALGAPASLGVTMVLGGRITLIAHAVVGLTLIGASSAVEHGTQQLRHWRTLRRPAAPSVHAALRPDVLGPSCELPPCEPKPATADGSSRA